MYKIIDNAEKELIWIKKKECLSHIWLEKKRKKTKEIVKTVEKRKRADARNLKKKNKKIKKRQQKVLVSD